MTSYLGRLNYDYAGRYYVSGSFRRDGSSRLSRDSRWGNFWSVSGSWRLSQEAFMESLSNVINDAKIGNKVPSAATLEKIAKDGDVDIVIAVQLDKLDDKAIDSSEERRLQIDLQGYAVAYNKLTGKAYEHRIYSDKTIPEALTSRWDWTHEEFGRAVRIEVDRALRSK